MAQIRLTETVRIGLLGTLQVHDGDGREVRVGGQRLRALLILLALDPGRVVSAHSLIRRLWPDDQPADAANALQSLVSRLRATLRQAGVDDGVLESSPAGYRLAVAPEMVDAVTFETGAKAGARALAAGDAPAAATMLRDALAAWRGPALADVADEGFAAAHAARLEELRSTAVLDRIEADLACGPGGPGAPGVLISELRAMTTADPLAERPRALLMRALAAAGRQADALAAYTQGRELLADRLGVDPSPRLEEVYLAILRQEVPLQPPAVAVAPAATVAPSAYPERTVPTALRPAPACGGQRPPTSFIGRDDDVWSVLKKLAEERLVTLTGPGGVGKTRLAAEAAARLTAPAWFAALAPVADPSQVPHVVLDALGMRERGFARHAADPSGSGAAPADPVDRLCAALGDREAVLILDNCEQVVDAAARLADRILAECASLRILATSREPLRIPGETLWVVSPLAIPPAPATPSPSPPATPAAPPPATPAAPPPATPVAPPPATAVAPPPATPAAPPPATAAAPPPATAAAPPPATPVAPPPATPVAPPPATAAAPPPATPVAPPPATPVAPPPATAVAPPPATPAAPPPATPAAPQPDISDISIYPAVRLFRDRAFAVLPSFALDGGNAAAVVRICRALDGLPLAIELAAVWLRTLTPAQLAERLDDRFALLTGGSRTALPRHQTLRAVVDWSWDLLSEPERVLARRLAVFPGGATLAAAEQVCIDAALPRTAVLPALSGLVGKSILILGDAGPRYRMLETVRAYAAERLAEAGEETQVKDAFAAYYLNVAETADPLLRTSGQVHWFRLLTAEQDNAHAALRWLIANRDAEAALRFVRALSYFWVQLGHGEGDTLARETLALEPPPLTTQLIAEARAICALLAAGWSWDIEAIRDQLTEALAALSAWEHQFGTFHPIAAAAEALLAQFDGATDRALALFERYTTVDNRWLRAMGRLYRASYGSALGRLEGAEDDCLAALAEFRAMGETWGSAITLTQLAEFVELRADHAVTIAALEEAAALGRELGSWGDIGYVEGRLAVVRARAGEIARARADLDRVEREAAERGRHSDTGHWVAFQRAELAWREEDLAGVTRCCVAILGTLDSLSAPWWQSLRAQVKARLAMVALRQADLPRCHDLLGEALQSVTAWVEHPALAVVLDAVAAYVLARGSDGDAELAATLLGAAHGIRGAFDESSLDAPPARAAARAALGAQAFGTAYAQGRQLDYPAALAHARAALTP